MSKQHQKRDRLVLLNTQPPRSVPPKFSKKDLKPYSLKDLFANIGKIEFAEPVMNFADKGHVNPHEYYWGHISNKVFEGDAEHKLNKYKKAEKQKSWFWRNIGKRLE